jgi:hypothetical protein
VSSLHIKLYTNNAHVRLETPAREQLTLTMVIPSLSPGFNAFLPGLIALRFVPASRRIGLCRDTTRAPRWRPGLVRRGNMPFRLRCDYNGKGSYMSVEIDISPDLEADLRAEAQRHGMSLEAYAEDLLNRVYSQDIYSIR